MANSDGPKDYQEKGWFEGLECSLHVRAEMEYRSPLSALEESLFT